MLSHTAKMSELESRSNPIVISDKEPVSNSQELITRREATITNPNPDTNSTDYLPVPVLLSQPTVLPNLYYLCINLIRT